MDVSNLCCWDNTKSAIFIAYNLLTFEIYEICTLLHFWNPVWKPRREPLQSTTRAPSESNLKTVKSASGKRHPGAHRSRLKFFLKSWWSIRQHFVTIFFQSCQMWQTAVTIESFGKNDFRFLQKSMKFGRYFWLFTSTYFSFDIFWYFVVLEYSYTSWCINFHILTK